MSIHWREVGSIFDAPVAYRNDPLFGISRHLVCPVNCEPGVMGAGLAKAFADRWPDLIGEHRAACRSGDLKPGKTVWVGGSSAGATVVFFPTKDRWRQGSHIKLIYFGLADMARRIDRYTFQIAVVFPALGCGLGGLQWSGVRPLIEGMAGIFPHHQFVVYGPSAASEATA